MPRKMNVHPIIAQIINRDCHVGLSNMAVIRHVIDHLREKHRTFRGMKRKDRRRFLRECIAQHRYNRELYRHVMRRV